MLSKNATPNTAIGFAVIDPTHFAKLPTSILVALASGNLLVGNASNSAGSAVMLTK